MKFPVPALLLALALTSGCSWLHLKSKKAAPPPELPPAAGIEAEFHQRWMDRRIHELLAAGSAKTEEEAKTMAAAEFAKQYPFIHAPAAKSGG
ncbi:MAG TPA: hypothetical protein VFC28_06555 [Opitutaceae bacterium]|jgi:outer membrane lipopolysaccharide assembly protein LptE/RlpB|nr:hypothetical protein [Opitutaceae bacterium]